MINLESLEIIKLEDYDGLNTLVNEEYLHEHFINEFKQRIGLKVNKIIIEYPYYDKDYLSTYYIYYSKKHKIFSKNCYRLHFFKNDSYYGYFTLRPTAHYTKIGKSYVYPKLLLNNKAYLILGDFEIQFAGNEVSVNVFPWMYQETDISVCAHVATWSIIRYYGNKYKNYADACMGDVIEKTPEFMNRKVPSKGLNLLQIPGILRQFGFSPLLIQQQLTKEDEFYDELIAYIESGIPFIGVMTKKHHAVSVIGHGDIDYTLLNQKTGQGLISNSELINSLIINDDNFLPYIEVTKKSAPAQNNVASYNIEDIDYAIVPLYDKMQLEYGFVKIRVNDYINLGNLSYISDKVVRIYITSSNSLKKKTFNSATMNNELKNLILRMNMPKFVWCVDISSIEEYKNSLTSGRMIIDTTASTFDLEPWLLIHDNIEILYKDNGKLMKEDISINPYEIYKNNLREV
ncbi:MAG: hypothetical protein P4L59_08175 [Desulfosporosinus sp.]|nr:hypothetical protein [Desulfosporosinus sp.]